MEISIIPLRGSLHLSIIMVVRHSTVAVEICSMGKIPLGGAVEVPIGPKDSKCTCCGRKFPYDGRKPSQCDSCLRANIERRLKT